MKHTQLSALSPRITYVSGRQNYTYLHLKDAPDRLIAHPILFCLQHLTNFLRIHKGFAVNLTFVSQVRQQNFNMEVCVSERWLPVARRRKAWVIEQLRSHYQPTLLPGLHPARTR